MRAARASILLASALGFGCGGATMTDWWTDNAYASHGADAASRGDGIYVSDSYAEAGAAAALAGVLWGAAGGCKIEGCEPPLRCNTKTELCEPARCGEGHACPAGTRCNFDERVCEP